MSISPVSSSISSGYDSTEVQKLKLKSGNEALSQKTEHVKENEVVDSKRIESKLEVSSEDRSTVGTSIHGDTVEISKQGMSKAQEMSAASNSVLAEQSASTQTASTVSATATVSATSTKSAQAAAVLKSSETEDTESSTTSSTASLSNDSEYDLKQKLANGDITQSQYDNELKKRGKGTESAEVNK
ncbi:hypothetical protein [Fusibacter sp. 3D3]|uniref:hypothetical protein n=1 Tax=Fusibacter sp. 3D3 TaxID=1048380 RepID=UPI000852BEA4|nr:hypothetical protein [Fusibacter sp. 3D3]GAU79682.1 hypothetical protein F3D3_4346 [Fusibacter sp. 3D3]